MPTNRKWLLLPPAVALLLVLGPLSMQSGAAAVQPGAPADAPLAATQEAQAPATPSPANTRRTGDERQVPALPRTPDLWQVGSTLIGVLLLGGVGVFVLRRLRNGPSSSGTGTIALRQTLRLSPKQAVHAIEFDGRMLLVGEGERGLQLLHASGGNEPALDEGIVARRAQEVPAEDDGAVPKDLVLPRPPARPAAAANVRRAPLGDFRALLAKAGR